MKNLIVTMLFICFTYAVYSQDPGERREAVRVSDFSSAKVIGFLGVPLGDAFEIEATIVSGSASRAKSKAGRYFLKVETVNGKQLESPREYSFDVWTFADADVANDHFSLYELKKQFKTEQLTSEEIRELEKGYVGSKVKLVVYETGSFVGQPNKLPPDIEWGIADTGFHFRAELIVLKQRK